MPERSGSRVLLVERNSKSRNFRTVVLGTHGFEVEAVSSMADLPAAWRGSEFDLVLLSLGKSGTTHEMATWRRIQREHPLQRFMFILSAPERLCPLYFNEAQVRDEELSDAFVGRVEAALGPEIQADAQLRRSTMVGGS